MTNNDLVVPRHGVSPDSRRRSLWQRLKDLPARLVPVRARGSQRFSSVGKLVRTTAFKLTLVHLTVFCLFAACLLGYFAWNTRRLITEQINRTVDAEITGLSEQYNQGGIRRLVFVIDARARRPGSSLYLVTTFSGDGLEIGRAHV